MPSRKSVALSRISASAGWLRRHKDQITSHADGSSTTPKVRLGVCAMDKKAQSKPMLAILKRMNTAHEFELVFFGDDMILNKPIEQWPRVAALLVWESSGFPLHKAQRYARKIKPFLVNDVFMQDNLLDRRKVYNTLTKNMIPLPPHIIVDRSKEQIEKQQDPEGFEETHDYVAMNGVKINKPFVEKPSLGENHNVWIYYPNSMGGGVKTMFRKIGNKSADYLPNHPGTVRRDDSYIYEEFVATGGTDVKVYTVGPRYAHAEARKSPVVDGKVMRTADGKEVRYPVLLSNVEKEIAAAVVNAFQQRVCGFDLLRRDANTSYVCDVNGWSFVKSSKKYYDDAAGILRQLILEALQPHRFAQLPSLPRVLHNDDLPNTDVAGDVPDDTPQEEDEKKLLQEVEDLKDEMDYTNAVSAHEELRCVLAVIRHGDRTPKQKLKLQVTHQPFLDLFRKFSDGKGKQAKLKSPDELKAFLEAVRAVEQDLSDDAAADGRGPSEPVAAPADEDTGNAVAAIAGEASGAQDKAQQPDGGATKPVSKEDLPSSAPVTTAGASNGAALGSDSTTNGIPGDVPVAAPPQPDKANDMAMQQSLRIVRTVLEAGNAFSGINRKVQMKPTDAEESGVVTELQLIVKWGGVLTHLGREQAEELGKIYRMVMYPDSDGGGGLLRLHSTYRHDLKIYSSDEGRVQTSAAAFIKGLLDLEGSSLTPILVSLVKKDAAMLDVFGKGASNDIAESKRLLYQTLTFDPETSASHCVEPHLERASPPPSPSKDNNVQSGASRADTPALSADEAVPSQPPIPQLPEAPLQLLKDLYARVQDLTEQIRAKLYAQGANVDQGAKTYSAINKGCNDGQQEEDQPHGTETMLMMYDRWRKLERAMYKPKDDTFDISKVPDIYDSIKYDALHNKHLSGLDYRQVFPLAKKLADCVIPAEYGISPDFKLRIGHKIAKELIGKLLLDLDNVKAESFSADEDLRQRSVGTNGVVPFGGSNDVDVATGTSEGSQAHDSRGNDEIGDRRRSYSRGGGAAGGSAHTTGAADVVRGGDDDMMASTRGFSDEGGEDDEAQRVHRLAPQYVHDINSPLRHVRTRIYFTSESHIHSLINILRHEHLGGQRLLSPSACAMLDETTECDYLTQIVIRMYESKLVPPDSDERFRVEMQFSNGANHDPFEVDHDRLVSTRPRVRIHRDPPANLSLQEFHAHMSKWGTVRETGAASTARQTVHGAMAAAMGATLPSAAPS